MTSNTTEIVHDDGTIEDRTDGSPAWRHYNPGNLRGTAGDFGSIGTGGGFLVFDNYTDGVNAAYSNLQNYENRGMTIGQAIRTWAPPSDNNDTAGYTSFVEQHTGLSASTPLNSIDSAARSRIIGTIIQQEGWSPGTVTIRKGSGG